MPTVNTDELISIAEASKVGLSKLVREAEEGGQRVLMRNGKPVAALVGVAALERSEQLEMQLLDVSLALTRLVTTESDRHSLDDVLERFGVTRDDLVDD